MKPTIRDGRQIAALSVAGSDSGGNAGLQADVRAFHTFGLHACTVVAALTAQNPSGVSAVVVPDPAFVVAQLDAVLPAYAIGALKTGMLATREVIEAVAARLAAVPGIPKVVDPVMVATSGAKLLRDDAIDAMRARMLPLAALATPNLPEAEVLLGEAVGVVAVQDAQAGDIEPQRGADIAQHRLCLHSVGRFLFHINTKYRHGLSPLRSILCPAGIPAEVLSLLYHTFLKKAMLFRRFFGKMQAHLPAVHPKMCIKFVSRNCSKCRNSDKLPVFSERRMHFFVKCGIL